MNAVLLDWRSKRTDHVRVATAMNCIIVSYVIFYEAIVIYVVLATIASYSFGGVNTCPGGPGLLPRPETTCALRYVTD